jgi:hypothetical protein
LALIVVVVFVIGGRDGARGRGKKGGELILDLIMWWSGTVAAHYHYIKEIPMFAEYEIQLSIGGFEDKWVSPCGLIGGSFGCSSRRIVVVTSRHKIRNGKVGQRR